MMMVAYSFQKRFAPYIAARLKRQTIRGDRRRHARPSEPMQLYCGMRTKHCYKIIDDPICERVDEIRFNLRSLAGVEPPRTNCEALEQLREVVVEINDIPLDPVQWHDLAVADGFSGYVFTRTGELMAPIAAMAAFWMAEHGPILFRGVIIHWGDRA